MKSYWNRNHVDRRTSKILILGVYGFAFFPSRWISFKKDPNEAPKDLELIREMVGKYSYLALTLVVLMRFCAKIGVDVMPIIYVGEIFPMK